MFSIFTISGFRNSVEQQKDETLNQCFVLNTVGIQIAYAQNQTPKTLHLLSGN